MNHEHKNIVESEEPESGPDIDKMCHSRLRSVQAAQDEGWKPTHLNASVHLLIKENHSVVYLDHVGHAL